MIIEKLLSLVIKIFELLTFAINIPSMPSEVNEVMNTVFEYLTVGLQILTCYTNLSYLLVLFSLICSIDIGIGIYHFVMWILKKIPMLGIG